jgi:hypothetical protein
MTTMVRSCSGVVVPMPALPVLLRAFVCAGPTRGQPKKSASPRTTIVAWDILTVSVIEFLFILCLFRMFLLQTKQHQNLARTFFQWLKRLADQGSRHVHLAIANRERL